MKKKLLALVLAAVMILGFMPKNVKADETYPNPVTVYLSISDDDEYIEDYFGKPIAFREIQVPYFDLSNYGLSYYYFSSENYIPGTLQQGSSTSANGKVTLLHLFIYAMERYYFGYPESECGTGQHRGFITTLSLPSNNLSGSDEMVISGVPGSIYFENYWGINNLYDPENVDSGENWLYFRNYKYPIASSGYGSTADQIILRDGDVITLGHFSNSDFYGPLFDTDGIFAYARPYGESYNNTPPDDLTVLIEGVEQGNTLDLEFYHARIDYNFNPVEDANLPEDVPVFACRTTDLTSGAIYESGTSGQPWTYVDDTSGGIITVDTTGWAPGTYIIATPGWTSSTTFEIACAPGGILIEVIAAN